MLCERLPGILSRQRMTSALAEQDRQQRIGLLFGLGIASVMLWQTTFGMLLLYPFTILATWFHEMGHGIAAMVLGARFEQLLIFPDGSGVTLSSLPADASRLTEALIAAGGPLGPPLAGAALIIASRSPRSTRLALVGLGVVLLFSSLIWVRTLTGLVVLPLLAAAILATARYGGAGHQRFAIQLLGVQACISVWQQFDYLFTPGGRIEGQLQRSDTGAIADVLLLPYWFWGGAITIAICALMWWSFRIAFRR